MPRNCSKPFPYIKSFYSTNKIFFKKVDTIIVLMKTDEETKAQVT